MINQCKQPFRKKLVRFSAVAQSAEIPSPAPLPSARILVVEDDTASQLVVQAILRKLGYEVEIADDGGKALERLQRTRYDLVLMDCEMPGMDGYETARRIRQKETGVLNPQIPIIAVTAHALQGDRENCLKAGMNDYLSKPIEPNLLARALHEWLARSGNTNSNHVAPEDAQSIFDELGWS
jgi:CheY-like chemotaxis protein